MTQHRLNLVVHPGNGPHALVVHGALGSRSYWADNVGALAEVCQPVVVELWGHGRSPSPEHAGAYHPDTYVEQFESIRNELGIDRWVTIGQSMGAALTLRYGLAHPEAVLAQVITNSSSAFSNLAGWKEGHEATVLALADQVLNEGAGIMADSWVNPGRSKRISLATRELLAAEFAEHGTVGIANSLRYTNLHLPVSDRLEAVTAPTLLTLGILEETFLPLVKQARRIPNLEVVELQAAHAVNAQDPVGWNTAVVAFLHRTLNAGQ